jgi:hypothetical protein
MNHFGELLRLAGAAAANANSATHRAIACRDVDALGLAWTAPLPNAKAQLAAAIVSTVHALAAAPCAEHRCLVAKALRELVAAGRTPMPRQAATLRFAPRRYWLEVDR